MRAYFPCKAQKDLQYAQTAEMMADISTDIGTPINSTLRGTWAVTMSRLAVADEMAEQDPYVFPDGGSLARYLCDDEPAEPVCRAGQRLLDANIASLSTTDLNDHFHARAQEGRASLDLLWYQLPPELNRNDYVRNQLSSLAVLGVLLDSLADAREDSRDLPFTPRELVRGSLAAIAAAAPKADLRTWKAGIRAANRHGFSRYAIQKLYRKAKPTRLD